MNALQNKKPVENSGLSVTRICNDLKRGDQSAATQLWEFLRKRLLDLSKHVTRNNPGCSYDEQDVAVSAFATLCNGFESNRYEQVANRDELWRLLAVITVNKARKKAAYETRIKRGGRFNRIENGEQILALLPDREPDPEFTLLMQEECSRLLNLLGKQELQMVALLKVEGYKNEEIAERMGCTRRAIQRRLALVKEVWSEEFH